MPWTSLCQLDELTENEGKFVEIDGFKLAVFLKGGTPYVLDDTCPHAGASLSGGHVDPTGCAVCPWHAWAFHLENGQLRDTPGVTIDSYKVRVVQPSRDRPKLVQADLPIY
jgi:nitrite reductase (NADH) small subunit/3-phenylpropionate/trans-cinnamate dioxygenase ferredoxin subunit